MPSPPCFLGPWDLDGECICRSTLRRPFAVCPSYLVHTIPSSPPPPPNLLFFAMAYSGCHPRSRAWRWILGWVKLSTFKVGPLSAFFFFFFFARPPCRPSLVFITILIHFTPRTFRPPPRDLLNSLTWRPDLTLPITSSNAAAAQLPHILPYVFLNPRTLPTVPALGYCCFRWRTVYPHSVPFFPFSFFLFLFLLCVLYTISALQYIQTLQGPTAIHSSRI